MSPALQAKLAYLSHAAFIARCALVAALSYIVAHKIGLGFPAWAAISGLVVSQDRLQQTRDAMSDRFVGTLIGIVVAVFSGGLLARVHLTVALQMAVAVAICAAVARRHPRFRVCMWTCPAVFLTTTSTTSIFHTGFDRGVEVVIGGVIAGVLNLIFDRVLLRGAA
jgi:uncharacterized membrane protein YgaE (UPF0421/DUF939 family)